MGQALHLYQLGKKQRFQMQHYCQGTENGRNLYSTSCFLQQGNIAKLLWEKGLAVSNQLVCIQAAAGHSWPVPPISKIYPTVNYRNLVSIILSILNPERWLSLNYMFVLQELYSHLPLTLQSLWDGRGRGRAKEKITVHLLCSMFFFLCMADDTAFIHQKINSVIMCILRKYLLVQYHQHLGRQFCYHRNPITLCSCFELCDWIKG